MSQTLRKNPAEAGQSLGGVLLTRSPSNVCESCFIQHKLPINSALGELDGVIGRPAFRSLEIVGAALQADGETRSAFAASSIRRRSAAWTILLDWT